MRTRTVLLSLVVLTVAVAVWAADDPFMGTWKLNEAKSKTAAGAPKVSTVVYEAEGDQVKITVDGTGANGNAIHDEWTGKFDGKNYPVTGNALSDMRAYTKVNDRTLKFASKKGSKVVNSGTIALAADGKSRTVTRTDVTADGKEVKSTQVYEKQ